MNQSFEIILEDDGARAAAYSIRLDGSEVTEFARFHEEFQTHEDFLPLMRKLQRMMDHTGFDQALFAPEGRASDTMMALKYGDLRIFCLVWEKTFIILGGGGEKLTHTYNEDPVLHAHATTLQLIDAILAKAFKSEIIETDYTGRLAGQMKFNF